MKDGDAPDRRIVQIMIVGIFSLIEDACSSASLTAEPNKSDSPDFIVHAHFVTIPQVLKTSG
jgi:hypothetical protein